MGRRRLPTWLILLTLPIMGCAGPTSPFGAVHSLSPWSSNKAPALKGKATHGANAPSLTLSPKRQVLHTASHLQLQVHDPLGIPKEARLMIVHNGRNVTEQFITTASRHLQASKKELTVDISDLRFQAAKKNNILFVYKRNSKAPAVVEIYKPPECALEKIQKVQTTKPFEPRPRVMENVHYWAKKNNINPSFLAGLVAQESGFDPTAVSWAKAIGLTQVTPLANEEVTRIHASWPRSTKVQRYPAAALKSMILAGQLGPSEDWRLDPQLSLRGGLTFIEYLKDYWSAPRNAKKLEEVFQSVPIPLTEVILASYNSGAARVKYAMERFGKQYLQADSLKAARKYVRLVESYCYHFGEGYELAP